MTCSCYWALLPGYLSLLPVLINPITSSCYLITNSWYSGTGSCYLFLRAGTFCFVGTSDPIGGFHTVPKLLPVGNEVGESEMSEKLLEGRHSCQLGPHLPVYQSACPQEFSAQHYPCKTVPALESMHLVDPS